MYTCRNTTKNLQGNVKHFLFKRLRMTRQAGVAITFTYNLRMNFISLVPIITTSLFAFTLLPYLLDDLILVNGSLKM